MEIIKSNVVFVTGTPNALSLIEDCGRVCYQSESKDADKFIRMLISKGHESVLEHASATFHITCDRGITHELVRHRIASYSQESTRYCKYSNGLRFILPFDLTADEEVVWRQHLAEVEGLYLRLIDEGAPPQVARDILPNCLAAEIRVTMNFRAWRHFIKLRTAEGAHPKIQEVAYRVLAELVNYYRACFADLIK